MSCDAHNSTGWRPFRRSALVWIALALIIGAAAALRFTGLNKEGRWGDEYRQTRSYTLPIRYLVDEARSAGQPPLDYLIGWTLAKFGHSDRIRRLPAAFFGVLGVAALFFLARRLVSVQAGLIAAGLLAFSPLHWALSQDARPYTLATAAMLVTLLALVRALERPDPTRLIAYGLVSYLFTFTIGLLPLVVLCSIALVISALWLMQRFRARSSARILENAPTDSESCTPDGDASGVRPADSAGIALRRVGILTLVVGIATIPLVLYLLSDESYTVFSEGGREAGTTLGLAPWPRLFSNAAGWKPLPSALFGFGWPLAIALAVVGALMCLRRHGLKRSSQVIQTPKPGAYDERTATSCVLVVMALIGPLFLLTFTACVVVAPIRVRYGLFMGPVVATFAAIALGAAIRWFRTVVANQTIGRLGGALAVLLLFAGPAARTIALTGKYFREDWRGCAAYLAKRTSAEDVIMVREDRPVSEPRMTFWGKFDWPPEMAGPLAEPIRSLAQSESHWQRLCHHTGRCIIVVRYQVGAEDRDDYRSRGLQQAPPHLALTKFRGLDVLERVQESSSPIGRMIDACNDLLALPRTHPDGAAFLYALRSRLELYRGDFVTAAASFERARSVVPEKLHQWFDEQLAVHVAALQEVEAIAESKRSDGLENRGDAPVASR